MDTSLHGAFTSSQLGEAVCIGDFVNTGHKVAIDNLIQPRAEPMRGGMPENLRYPFIAGAAALALGGLASVVLYAVMKALGQAKNETTRRRAEPRGDHD